MIKDNSLTKQIFYHANGNIAAISFRDKDGEEHMENGPACVEWWENGKIKSKFYYNHGKSHRVNGPAYTTWDLDGSKECEKYFLNGKLIISKSTKEFKKIIKLMVFK